VHTHMFPSARRASHRRTPGLLCTQSATGTRLRTPATQPAWVHSRVPTIANWPVGEQGQNPPVTDHVLMNPAPDGKKIEIFINPGPRLFRSARGLWRESWPSTRIDPLSPFAKRRDLFC
jgi:hypothetical protein